MPLPLAGAALSFALAPMFAAIVRVIAGTFVAYQTYQLLDTLVRPYIEDIFIAIIGTAQEIQGLGGIGSLLSYFEFVKIVQIIVSAYSAAFAIRIARASFSAFNSQS